VNKIDLDLIRKEREEWLKWKNIAPIREKIELLKNSFPQYFDSDVQIRENKTFEINNSEQKITEEFSKQLEETAKSMKPWRKGPFQLFDLFIDTEWQSFIKYNKIIKSVNLKNKIVGDIGANNGYYMLRMSQEPEENRPAEIIGFDPAPLYKTQFEFISMFAKKNETKLSFELLGVEHVEFYEKKFDILFCLGVLYHRSDPIETLKSLKKGLKSGGELILDTLIIDSKSNNLPEDYCLVPKERYAKMRNVYFVPTVTVLESWSKMAKFRSFELLETVKTTFEEQRKTDWIDGDSLETFLNPEDLTQTVENYPAPLRAYIKLTI
jgi:tRNA (mo5U34)-methyltransferase